MHSVREVTEVCIIAPEESSRPRGFKLRPIPKRGIAGITIVLALSLLVFFPEAIPWYSNHNMDWNTEIGDKLTYSITYTAVQPISDQWSEFRMIELVGVEVVFEVTSLPTIPRVVRTGNFLEDVILFGKVTCYFPNGSLLPISYSSHLNKYVSSCILPVNGSSLLDSLYPDMAINSLVGGEGTFYYLQEMNSDDMVIGSKSFWYYDVGHGGGGTGWYGEFIKATGTPHHIVVEYYVPQSTGCGLSERIVLTLID